MENQDRTCPSLTVTTSVTCRHTQKALTRQCDRCDGCDGHPAPTPTKNNLTTSEIQTRMTDYKEVRTLAGHYAQTTRKRPKPETRLQRRRSRNAPITQTRLNIRTNEHPTTRQLQSRQTPPHRTTTPRRLHRIEGGLNGKADSRRRKRISRT